MIATLLPETGSRLEFRTHDSRAVGRRMPFWEAYVAYRGSMPLSQQPGWLTVLQQGLQHVPYCVEALDEGKTRGLLPLVYVQSFLFGRFLVSLPYVNYGGILADDEPTALGLVDRAVELADQLKVRYLELRHLQSLDHPSLNHVVSSKVHMRLELPARPEQLWARLPSKVRNQIRKGQKSDLTVVWGETDLLPEFYSVFSQNMRDLGTPVYGRGLFLSVLRRFPQHAELCVVRAGAQPVAAALLLHGKAIVEVPSASSLREFNSTCANMLMYWHLMERAVQRGHAFFDFGRCSPDSPTYRFKKQWGAVPVQAVWQYYLRQGSIRDMRPDNPRYGQLISIWKRLPLSLTRLIGPPIVRGIP